MTLQYFETAPVDHLVRELFCLSISEKVVPFESKIVPVGFTSITYMYGSGKCFYKGKALARLEKIMITGHFHSAYNIEIENEATSFGINFHPTGLFKLLGKDISQFTNLHQEFNNQHHSLATNFKKVFGKYDSNWEKLAEEIKLLISKAELYSDEKLEEIDHAIQIIEENEGMVNVNDVLAELSFSQKTLETHFKRIVGITPGRYIRLVRFTKLMRKYESQEINIKDLIHMYDYYDRSHFSKDFRSFMNESMKTYFKKDFPLIREYLK